MTAALIAPVGAVLSTVHVHVMPGRATTALGTLRPTLEEAHVRWRRKLT